MAWSMAWSLAPKATQIATGRLAGECDAIDPLRRAKCWRMSTRKASVWYGRAGITQERWWGSCRWMMRCPIREGNGYGEARLRGEAREAQSRLVWNEGEREKRQWSPSDYGCGRVRWQKKMVASEMTICRSHQADSWILLDRYCDQRSLVSNGDKKQSLNHPNAEFGCQWTPQRPMSPSDAVPLTTLRSYLQRRRRQFKTLLAGISLAYSIAIRVWWSCAIA